MYDLGDHLRTFGKRITPAKKEVFNLLNNHTALTINDLRAQTNGRIDQATLYRVLNQFRRYQIINDVVIDGVRKVELSERYSDHHHHMVCKECGDVITIHDLKLEQYLKLLAAKKGFIHTSHSFEIQGVCPKCLPAYQRLAKQSVGVSDS